MKPRITYREYYMYGMRGRILRCADARTIGVGSTPRAVFDDWTSEQRWTSRLANALFGWIT